MALQILKAFDLLAFLVVPEVVEHQVVLEAVVPAAVQPSPVLIVEHAVKHLQLQNWK